MAIERRLYTVEEFEAYADAPENQHRLLELIDGEIREKMPTEQHGYYAGNIFGHLWNFVNQHKLGRVAIEVRHRKPDDKQNALIPDVSFNSAKRPLVAKGSVPELPDLVVEVKSPDDNLKDLRDKMRYYIANGVKIGWLVIPEKRLIEVYTTEREDVLTENDTLTGGDVLPGFTLPVRDVFADPMA